jgi:trk system potassium uptake protein TrkH
VAGFTTTGSTVISHIDAAPRGLLLWRALTQWLGGMGIIVFALAILPILGVGGMQLFRAEIPGPTINKLRPRIAATARRLLLIYVALTATELIALRLAGLSIYDALCHALTTVSTGGFSTRDGSIGAYGSSTVEWIVIIFMLAGGINFTVHYYIATWQPKEVVRNLELRYFLGVVFAPTVLIAWMLVGSELEPQDAARTTLFQVVSIVTTTGYVTADFSRWPALATMILLLLMILGGMTGSTSGGIKGMRAIVAFQVVRSTILRSLHSSAVVPVRYSGAPVPIGVLTDVWSFLTAYFVIAAATAALIAGAGYDLATSVSASLTAIGNVGPGLGAVGPTETFVHFPGHVKLALSFCMIAGRLEVFTLLILILPRFWNR